MNIRSLSIRNRLIALVTLSLLLLAFAAFYTAMLQRQQMILDREAKTRSLVETAQTLIANFATQASAGKITLSEAQEQARLSMRAMRYDGDNYYTVMNTDHVIIEHPIRPELNGKNMADTKDPKGTLLFQNIVAAAKRGKGETTEYYWPKPGQSEPVKKLSASTLFTPWNWVITTGIYVDDVDTEFRNTVIVIAEVMVAGIILLLAVAWWITRSISVPIGEAVGAASRLAEGDLTVRLDTDSKDEVGQLMAAMQNMIARLTQIIGEVRTAADNLSNAAGQVSATAQSLSQSSSEQAASVEETTASMEQMTASISQNTENARVTDSMATKAADEAAEGGMAVSKTVEDMKSIANRISIIDDIAYQTNLLALNAAIEAARAGDHGKGFAVVAAEVRKLAERSQVAAQEIGDLASSSVTQAERAGNLLTTMVPSIRKTSDLVQEIAAASSEQSSGVAQINGAMGQLNQATQQNASASEELAATAEELGAQAEQLQQTMTFFRLDNNAKASASTQHPPAFSSAKPQAAPKSSLRSAQAIQVNESDFERY